MQPPGEYTTGNFTVSADEKKRLNPIYLLIL